MSIRVYDTVSGGTFIFPMEPEKITFGAAAKFIEYELIAHGDVAIPMGEELNTITWNGVLPGANKKNLPFVHDWKNPREIQEIWSVWRTKKRKLRITIDGTPINHGVYLKSYEIEYSGGVGDYSYKIEFLAAKDIEIKIEGNKSTQQEDTKPVEAEKQYVTVTSNRVNVRNSPSMSGKIIFVAKKGEQYEYAGQKSGSWYYIVAKGSKYWISSEVSTLSSGTLSTGTASSSSGSSGSGSRTYTVKQGDSLWAIAQKYYGSGSKYTTIKSANNLSGNTIYVGQKLKIP